MNKLPKYERIKRAAEKILSLPEYRKGKRWSELARLCRRKLPDVNPTTVNTYIPSLIDDYPDVFRKLSQEGKRNLYILHSKGRSDSRNWTRQETLAAFNLYFQTPYGKLHSRSEVVKALADKLGRSPGAVSRKLSNLAWHDTKARGLKNASKLDQEICQKYRTDREELAYKSAEALAAIEKRPVEEVSELPPDIIDDIAANSPKGEERERIVRARVNQASFRKAVLAVYENRCCITGLGDPELLIASHIIPWRENRGRLNPYNGLCLNPLHDRAFDRGFITVKPDGTILISARLRQEARNCEESAFIVRQAGEKIRMPKQFNLSGKFLRYHNKKIFREK